MCFSIVSDVKNGIDQFAEVAGERLKKIRAAKCR
jgi:hypothetical protein